MSPSIPDSLRPFLSRVIAALIASLATWLAVHYGINLDADTRHQLVDAIIGIIFPLFTIIFAVGHKLLDKWLNPSDAAGKHLAVEGKAESTRIKTEERATQAVEQAAIDAATSPKQ